MKSFSLTLITIAAAASVPSSLVDEILKPIVSTGLLSADLALQGSRGVLIDLADISFALSLKQESIPMVFTNVDSEAKKMLNEALDYPLKHDDGSCSAIWMVDTFEDIHGAKHFRSFNLPCGSPADLKDNDASNAATFVKYVSTSPIGNSTKLLPTATDAMALAETKDRSGLIGEITRDLMEYLMVCGGKPNVETCWNWIQEEINGNDKREKAQVALKLQQESEADAEKPTMVPGSSAVWREVIESTYQYWQTKADRPFPYQETQTISHRFNSYWYLYLQAPPYQQLYYTFLLVDALHNPNTQTATPEAVGFYLTNLEIDMHAERADGTGVDPANVYWIKSSPPTQNTQHTIGRSWSSTDSYSLSMNVGYDGQNFKGDLSFNYTHTFTASYEEKRDITDWSVVENTDPVVSTGRWRYYQSWPVDMLQNNYNNFPRNWESYYEQSWNPCRVKIPPNLSMYALGTHDSMVWAINPSLRSKDGRNLPIRYTLTFKPVLTALSCEIYDGHHKLHQVWLDPQTVGWNINVADLNNLRHVDQVN